LQTVSCLNSNASRIASLSSRTSLWRCSYSPSMQVLLEKNLRSTCSSPTSSRLMYFFPFIAIGSVFSVISVCRRQSLMKKLIFCVIYCSSSALTLDPLSDRLRI
jgi:hypothetical protein